MDPFNTAPDFILDLIFLKLNEEDLHETLRVSKSWFWASIRRIKKLKITPQDNPLKSMAKFYNNHPADEKLDWRDSFKHLVLDELVVINDIETTNYLVNNGCNTAELTIQTSGGEESPVTLASLRTFTRLQSLEYCTNSGIKWHPFIIECFKSSKCEFDPNKPCPIVAIKLNSSGWNAEGLVLLSVTKLSLSKVTIDFLRTMVDHCPKLQELHLSRAAITQEWHHVLPANVKRIILRLCYVDENVATDVNASTDAGRQLLPYLCQNWESVEKFHYDGRIGLIEKAVYEAFPQQTEEIFDCAFVNDDINLSSPFFQSREISVKCDVRNARRLIIPPAKSVKLEFDFNPFFEFSPRDACLEPGNVERFALLVPKDDVQNSAYPSKWSSMVPFTPGSFQGFSRLTSLTLIRVSASSIKMALDQCPSITKLKLMYLQKSTFGSMQKGSSYANVSELVLEKCKETMHKVFQVFPRLSKFTQSEGICEGGDWLCKHLIKEDKRYGVVFELYFENRYMVSNDLQESLSHAQQFLNEYLYTESMSYLKGFKLIPRVSKQKITYFN